VRSMSVGVRPGVLALQELVGARQTLLRDEALERREPVLVVAGAVVGLTARRRGLELCGERVGPLVPGETPLGRQAYGERERLCLPGLGEFATRVALGRTCR